MHFLEIEGNLFKLLLLLIFVDVLLFLIVAAAYLALIRTARWAIIAVFCCFRIILKRSGVKVSNLKMLI